jgi:hypothetical protein
MPRVKRTALAAGLFDEPPPEVVTNEVLMPPDGEARYWLLLGDAQVEALAAGFCPEDVSRQAHLMLGWRRRQARMAARANPPVHEGT